MQITPLEAVNLSVLNPAKDIKKWDIQRVTSNFITEPSTNEYHPDGLFSERIFGELGSENRFYNFGFIKLKTKIFTPKLYSNIITLKKFYKEVLSGNEYAKFSEKDKDLVLADEFDEGSGTGFSFFIENFDKIVFKKNNSILRNDKIETILKNRDNLFMEEFLVIPAGYRDFQINEYTYSTINTLYQTIMSYARSIPENDSKNSMFDPIRYGIQRKVNEVYDDLCNLLDGKQGFMRQKYAKRKVALGTRNVISAGSVTNCPPDDPQHFNCDETKVPLFEAMKMFQPLIMYNLKTFFFNQIFESSHGQTTLIDPKTRILNYVDLEIEEKNKYITSPGLLSFINKFRNVKIRFLPVVAKSENKNFYLFLIYTDGPDFYIFRNQQDFIRDYESKLQKKVDIKKIRSITYIEMFYMAAYLATFNKHGFFTRYPVLEVAGVFAAKIHLSSTDPAKVMYFKDITGMVEPIMFPNFPDLKGQTVDSLMLYPSHLAGMDADFDGDTCSAIGLLGDVENEEVKNYLNSPGSVVKPNGGLYNGFSTTLAKLTAYNLTRY